MVQSKHLLSFIDLSGGGGGAGGSSVGEIEDMLLEQVMTGKMSAYNRVNLALNLNKDGSTRSLKDAFQNLEKVGTYSYLFSTHSKDAFQNLEKVRIISIFFQHILRTHSRTWKR